MTDGTISGGHQALGSMARACVYTALFGGYERLTEQPAARDSSLDFLCFTDDPALVSETWTVHLVEPLLPRDPVRSQRALKIRAHATVPQYDTSLYIDNSILLKTRPEVLLEDLLPPGRGMAVMAHGFRETVGDEFRAVIEDRLDTVGRCDEQAAHYVESDPAYLDLRPLKGGLLLRRHKDPRVMAAMDLWFTHVLRYSRRDQLSLPYALRATGLDPLVHELDNFDSPYHVWPASSGRGRDASLWLRPQDDLEQARMELAAAESALDALRASRSWRWTSPARGLLGRFRQPVASQAISDSASPEPSQAATSR
jgi:alkaline ceramidase TOD1/glycosyltransferase MUCI70-like protein